MMSGVSSNLEKKREKRRRFTRDQREKKKYATSGCVSLELLEISI
jgi:hypothetical protein